jgi:nitrogen fixation protein FixH
MHTLFKSICVLFVLSLLAFPLTGCDNPPWEQGMTLILKVDAPKDGTTVTASAVTVNGRVVGTESANAKVTINNTDVPVKDGKFSTNVTLTEGKNVINVVAQSGQANLPQQVTVIYAPAKQ